MNVVNHIEIVATQTGLKETQASLEGIARSQDTVAKSSLSMEQAFERQERRFNASLRAQQDYEKVARQVNAAVAQNPALMERGNAVLEAAAAKYGQVSRAQQLFAEATKGVSGQLVALSAGFGPVGVALSSIPGWGLPAAVALGAVSKAMSYASEQSHALGQKAIDLKKFSETTGLTTDEVQAFRFEANKVGIGSDETEGALQKFTVAFESLREGSGSALEVLRRYRPDLAEQMQGVKSTAAAIDILSKAFDGLTTSQQNALSRSFFGRGGIEMTRLMSGLNLGAGTEAFQQSGRGLSQDQIETISRLELENRELKKHWNEGLAKTFAPEVLEAENTYYRTLLQITSELKKQGLSGAGAQLLAPAIEFLENPRGEGAKSGSAIAPTTEDLSALTKQAEDARAEIEAMQRELEKSSGSETWIDGMNSSLEQSRQNLARVNEQIERMKSAPSGAAPSEPGAVPLPQSRPPEADAGRTVSAQLADQQKILSVLGGIASVQDIVKGKELELARERERGLKLTQDQSAALIAQTTIQAELAQKSPGTFERQLDALKAVKDTYPELTAADAQRAQALDQQLTIIEAMPGQQRMAAEEQVRYTQLIDQGRTSVEATAISMQEMQVKQAQINAGAREQLSALQDQAGAASAVTASERIQADEIANINALLRQGVSAQLAMQLAAQQTKNAFAQISAGAQQQLVALRAQQGVAAARNTDARLAAQEEAKIVALLQQGVSLEQAMAIASQERTNAEEQVTAQYEKQLALAQAVTGAQKIAVMELAGDWREANVAIAEANSNVERQTFALEQQNDLIRARVNGTEASVLAEQAYVNAVRSGADAMQASALAAQTRLNAILKAEQAEEALRKSNQQKDESEFKAADDKAQSQVQDSTNKINQGYAGAANNAASTLEGLVHKYADAMEISLAEAMRNLGLPTSGVGIPITQFPMLISTTESAIEMAEKSKVTKQNADQAAEQANQDAKQKADQIASINTSAEQELHQLLNQSAVAAAQNDQERIRIEGEQKYNEEIAAGVDAGLARQIADQQMANALFDLGKKTVDNTSATNANTDSLDSMSPYYATDPRLSHLGFRPDSGVLDYDPFKLAPSGPPGPPALPSSVSRPAANSNDRPIYINLAFNAPVDRGVAAELKQTVYQSIQASSRQAQSMSN